MKASFERKLIAVISRVTGGGWNPGMDLHKIISELQSEKQRLDEAIQALERLSSSLALSPKSKKRGRPPGHKHSDEAAVEYPQTKAQGQ